MRPTVTLAPLDYLLAASKHLERTGLLICVHPFLNDRDDAVLPHGICADIYPVQIATAACQEETVIVSLPYPSDIFRISVLLLPRTAFDLQSLVLERGSLYFLAAIILHIKYIQMLDRGFLLARHLIFVGLEGRARLCSDVDDPEILDRAVVGKDSGEMA